MEAEAEAEAKKFFWMEAEAEAEVKKYFEMEAEAEAVQKFGASTSLVCVCACVYICMCVQCHVLVCDSVRACVCTWACERLVWSMSENLRRINKLYCPKSNWDAFYDQFQQSLPW